MPPKKDTKRTLILILKIALIVAGACLIITRTWTSEDAYIFFRYSQNFVNGHGLVFNLGERVEGFTAPLWLFVISAVKIITQAEYRISSIIISYIFSIAGLTILLFKNSQKKDKLYLPITVILLITNSAFRDFMTSGFETSLTFFLVASLACLIATKNLTKRPILTATIASLLVLNRPESLLIYGYLLFVHFLFSLKELKQIKKISAFYSTIQFLVPFMILVGGYQVFRMGYFSTLLPTTFYAKKGGSFYISQGLNYAWDFFYSYKLVTIVLALGIYQFASSNKGKKLKTLIYDESNLHILSSALITLAYIFYAGGDYMHGRSLLISFTLFCVFVEKPINDLFEKHVKTDESSFKSQWVLTLIFTYVFILIGLTQTPITVKANLRIRGIKDERHHFGGFPFELDKFRGYISKPYINHFNWAPRGSYYKDVSEAVGFPISVSMGNIGLFGFTAEDTINVMSCSLVDDFLARFPIEKRGTIGHEGEAHLEYLFTRRPTFSYTPFVIWNEAMHAKYEESRYSGAITDDSNGSFIPVFDLSNEVFIKKYSEITGVDIVASVDETVATYLRGLEAGTEPIKIPETIEFLGFLELYWKPFISEGNGLLLDNARAKLFSGRLSSSYEFFDTYLREKSELRWYHNTKPLTPTSFLESIKYSLTEGRESSSVTPLYEVKDYKDLEKPELSVDSLVYDSRSGGFVTQTKVRGSIEINPSKSEVLEGARVMKLDYRVEGEGDVITVLAEKKVLFEHTSSEPTMPIQTTHIYLNIQDLAQKETPINIILEAPNNHAYIVLEKISIY